jgi:hypothetical protein
MTTTDISNKPSLNRATTFQFFKYVVYCLLAFNVYQFFLEDFSSSSQTFAQGIALSEIIEAFTATIDTAAWVILLLLFELETYILDDDKIKGLLKWSMHLTRVLCYAIIVYSFYGYISKYLLIHRVIPFIIDNPCSLIGSSFTYVADIDEYLPITQTICSTFANIPLLQVVGTQIISTKETIVQEKIL